MVVLEDDFEEQPGEITQSVNQLADGHQQHAKPRRLEILFDS
jgi:hypothetical protein